MCPPDAHPPVTDRIAVVGGGIVGVAVARELLKRRPDADVTLFEKEDRLASHQTGRNSGVVHAGLYYEPGSHKAVLVPQGRRPSRGVLRTTRHPPNRLRQGSRGPR